MKHKLITVLMMVFSLAAGVVHAQTAEAPTAPTFLSGGVGDEDRARLESMEKGFSFKLMLAGEGGVFLDGVHVSITDAAKNSVLVTDTEGPILLVQLNPGKYTVTAEVQGLTQTQKVTIRKNRQTNITIRFPISE